MDSQLTDEQKYMIECQLLGRCLSWLKAKMEDASFVDRHGLKLSKPPSIEWYQDLETDKLTCKVTVEHDMAFSPGQKCGIKAVEPWTGIFWPSANFDLAPDEEPLPQPNKE